MNEKEKNDELLKCQGPTIYWLVPGTFFFKTVNILKKRFLNIQQIKYNKKQ